VLLREALNIFKRKAPEDLKPFHAHLEQKYEEMCLQIKQEYNLKVFNFIFSFLRPFLLQTVCCNWIFPAQILFIYHIYK
jgi:hypothetical protein